MSKTNLLQKIKSRKAVVSVVGLGYVGLPLAMAISRSGFKTFGIDISRERIASLKRGESYIDDISNEELAAFYKENRFTESLRFDVISKSDCVVICVPTPLGKKKEPDLSYVLDAAKSVSRWLRKGQLVVLESTTYPGTTEENIKPLMEQVSGVRVGTELFLGFSPERVDPANRKWSITQIPKVVGGVNPASTELMKAFYESVFERVVPVSSSRAAEMVKLLENTFRSINIGLINEMAVVCDTLKLDIWEVIRAASTKPFGFMPFYPGPGIGGHCINVDSMYLAWKSRLHGYEPRLIELAQTINDEMPFWVIERAKRILAKNRKYLKDSKVLVLGVAYKKNVRDIRESPSVEIMDVLAKEGSVLEYHDPHVPQIRAGRKTFRSKPLTRALLRGKDLVMVLTDHDAVDYALIKDANVPVLDTRNVFKDAVAKHIEKL